MAGAAGWRLFIGFVDGPLLVALFTTRSEHSPASVRATVFTVAASAKLGAASIGAVAAAEWLDGRATGAGLVAIGGVHLVAAVAGSLVSVRILVTRATTIRTET